MRFFIILILIGLPVAATAQVEWSGSAEIEYRKYGAEAHPYRNATPAGDVALYLPSVRLAADVPLNDQWSFTAVAQTDYYGQSAAHPLFIGLAQVSWWPTESGPTVHAGRIIIPFGRTSERFLSTETPFRHLPLTHEWTTRIDKRYGYTGGPRNYGVAPGLTVVYQRQYTHGLAVQGGVEQWRLAYHVAMAHRAPAGFADTGFERQAFMGRLTWEPVLGLKVGASGAHGPYMKPDDVNAMLGDDLANYDQTAWGLDAEFAYKYLSVAGELIRSRWEAPVILMSGVLLDDDRVYTTWHRSVEGLLDLWMLPGFYVAGRYEEMEFPDLKRWEAGIGWRLDRNIRLKVTGRNEGIGAQLSVSF